MATPTQLSIYNEALLLCEERTLASLSESRKPRFLLDQVWNDNGLRDCLSEGQWTFATRSISVTYDPNIQPAFGYIHAFQQPADFVRTCGVASDGYFNSALSQFADENGYWWGDMDTMFVKFVSSDPSYGLDLTLWPEYFTRFVEAHFATKIVGPLTHDNNLKMTLEKKREQTLDSARSKNGINEPAGFFPRGQLSRARQGLYFGRPDRNGSGWY